jgi:hypothetical protein
MAEVKGRFWLSEKEQEALDNGLSPIEFMIDTFRDEALAHDIRMDAAKVLLPFVTKRAPQAVEVSGPGGSDISFREQSAIRSKLEKMLGIEA